MRRPALACALLLGTLAAAANARAAALPPPTVTISNPMVTEGNAGLTVFKAQVSFVTFGAIPIGGSSVEVDISARPGTASADDFVFAPVHLTVTAATQEITGAIVGDKVFEGDEAFTLVATPTAGFAASQGGIVTIVDDDQDVAPKLTIDAVTTMPEGNAGWHTINVPVRLQPAVAGVVSVDFATSGGNPAYDAGGQTIGDYKATTDTLEFAPGETVQSIPIQVLGDTVWEPDSSITLTLSNPRGAVLTSTLAKVVLTNDDAPSGLSIADLQVPEGNAGKTTVDIHIHMDPPAPAGSKVWVTIKGGSAVDGQDFTGSGFQVLYPTGKQSELTVPIDILGDTLPECDEGLTIQYQGVYLGDDTMKTAHLVIVDDDGGPRSGCADLFTPSGDPTPPPPPPPPPDAGAADQDATPTPPPGPDKTSPTPPTTTDAGTPPAKSGPTPPQATGGAGAAGSERLPDRGCAVAPASGAPTSALAFPALVAISLLLRRRRVR